MLGDPKLANIGLPKVMVCLPPVWLALVPIIFIESGYGTWRYRFPLGRSLAAQSIANCLSTLIGIPITWLILVPVQFVALEWSGGVIPKSLFPILSPVLGAAWLAPGNEQGWWILAVVIAVWTFFFYLMSVASEGFVVARFFNAALRGDRDILEALLSAAADVNARTSTGSTALKEAQLRGHKNIADRLVQAGAIDYPNGLRQ